LTPRPGRAEPRPGIGTLAVASAVYVDPALATALAGEDRLPALVSCELQTLELLANGLTAALIAQRL